MSKRSGSSYRVSSRLAAASINMMVEPCRNRHTVDLRVPRREPRDVEQRRFEAQRLLDRLRDQRPVRTDRLQLLRLCEQQIQEVSGRSERRLDPSGKEQPQEGEDLVVAQPFAVELGVGEPADQVLTRRSAPVRQDAASCTPRPRGTRRWPRPAWPGSSGWRSTTAGTACSPLGATPKSPR